VNIVWAKAATADLVAIRQFIADHNPTAANAMAARILRSANLLKDRPHLGLSSHRQNVRRLIVSQSTYSIIYRVSGSNIQIPKTFDGRRLAPRIR
jgi:toxin ParE1/3/4